LKHPKLQIPRAKESSTAEPAPISSASTPESSASPAQNPRAPQQEEPQFVEEDLLPAPALDFSKADSSGIAAARYSPVTTSAGGSAPIRAILLGVGLLAAIGSALWFGVPGLGSKSKRTSPAPPIPGAAAVKSSASPNPPDIAKISAAPSAAIGKTETAAPDHPQPDQPQPEPSKSDPSKEDAVIANADLPVVAPVAVGVAPSRVQPMPAGGHDRVANAKVSPAMREMNAVRQDPVPATLIGDSAGIVAPKLIQSVRAVPPPEALKNFVTGNIVLDALVDPSGHVKSATVLSGPEQLRAAAMNAVRQYRYEPALRAGKPVPAHVQATVQFWYEP